MFAKYCPVHNARVLLFADNIDELRNTADGIEVHYTCSCGHHDVWHAGRRRVASVEAASSFRD